MDQTEDLSRAYANADFITDAASYPPRWAAEAATFRATLGARARTGLPYGPGPRQCFDLFLPEGPARGLLIFIHGGYWLAFGPGDWSAFAQGALARGWAVAMPGYTLAPEARIGAMTREIEAAITAVAGMVEGPIVVTGHSAGGHLSARMACADLTPDWADRLRRVVPISPLADLRPLRRTGMNEKLKLDEAEARAESPALLPRRAGSEVFIWVGAQERPAFLWQARLLSEEWHCPWHAATGRHHFDVIDPMRAPESNLMEVLLGGL
ncbi:MAG: alpha/beta hydrolase [Pararhodobacter sp.]|nr:alpha/beta hydrolase [Pararhodobacter sp.]